METIPGLWRMDEPSRVAAAPSTDRPATQHGTCGVGACEVPAD